MSVVESAFDGFDPVVADWFRRRYGDPTEAQRRSWPLIKSGSNVLIHSPTGSGKTLAAFYSAIDDSYSADASSRLAGVRVLYISPLRALNYDIERNLQEPVLGIASEFDAAGTPRRSLTMDVRTGDTPASDRARMVRNPPEFLITTPESLYLILTSPRARNVLRTVETVIVDEIHTMCSNKRGVHLAVSLERLERLSPGFQRIGLSATQRPLSEVARLLGGNPVSEGGVPKPRDVEVVDCADRPNLEVKVIGMPERDAAGHADSVWEGVIPKVLDDIEQHQTTLVFTNSRRQAENTADRLNQVLVARDAGIAESAAVGGGERGSGVFDGPFKAHHGSISDAMRHQIERDLKLGKLPAVVGTSSLELGIDIGSINMVVQLQSPKSVAQGLQRVGRAGHQVGATSSAKVYATHPEDLLEATVVARGMLDGEIEAMHIPANALDVLAQHIVSAVALESWAVRDLYDAVRGAYPYRDLEYASFESVVRLVSGHYPSRQFGSLKARVHWDRGRDVLEALPGTRMAAMANAGAIVDRGAFRVVLPDRETTVGELDEEFVYESAEGDVFALGSQVWRALEIDDNRVVAEPAPGEIPRMPFWRGEYPWRPSDLGLRYGRFRAEVAARLGQYVDDDDDPPAVMNWLTGEYPIDEAAARQIIGHVRSQLRSCGAISSDREVVVESYRDDVGDWRIVVHSSFGGRINGPWSVALIKELRERGYVEPEVQVNDDGFMLRLPEATGEPPIEVIRDLTSEVARRHILDGIIDSPMFGATFRQNASRSLLMPSLGFGKRTPFWLQRLRSKDLLSVARGLPDFPVLLETYRDVMEDVMDLPGLTGVLDGIRDGGVRVVHAPTETPSPIARGLDWRFIDHWMYQWDTPNAERALQTLSADRDALVALFKEPGAAGLLRQEAFAGGQDGVADVQTRARSATELVQILIECGDMTDGELADACGSNRDEWLGTLLTAGRVFGHVLAGDDGTRVQIWIASDHRTTYEAAWGDAPEIESLAEVIARHIHLRGPIDEAELNARYPVGEHWIASAVDSLVSAGFIARGYFTQSLIPELIAVAELEEVRARTLAILRSEVEPVSPMRYQGELLRSEGIVGGTQAHGEQGMLEAIERLQGVSLEPLAWSARVLPPRVNDFGVGMLDRLLKDGEASWVFTAETPQPTLSLLLPRSGRIVLPDGMLESLEGFEPEDLEADLREVYEFVAGEGVVSTGDITRGMSGVARADLANRLAVLARRGLITCDSWGVAQAVADWKGELVGQTRYPSVRPMVPRSGSHVRRGLRREFVRRDREQLRLAPPDANWSATQRFAVMGATLTADERARARSEILLSRRGLVTRDALRNVGSDWDWSPILAALNLKELRGEVRRGYFVQGFSGIQFAANEFVESLRGENGSDANGDPGDGIAVVETSDPSWVLTREVLKRGASWSKGILSDRRLSGATVVMSDRPLLVTYSGFSRIYADAEAGDGELVDATRALLRHALGTRRAARIRVTEWDGEPVLRSQGADVLANAGFRRDYPYMVADSRSRASMGAVYN